MRDILTSILQATLSMCDVQLLTGLGILLSGFISLGLNSMSAYHWHLVAYLGWFSNLTHSSSLLLLRGYFHRNQGERWLRLVLMSILWVGLLTAIGPTLWFNWVHQPGLSTSAALSARCFYYPNVARTALRRRLCNDTEWINRFGGFSGCVQSTYSYRLNEEGAEGLESAILALTLAVISFCTRIVKLHSSWSSWVKRRIRKRIMDWFSKTASNPIRDMRILDQRPGPKGIFIATYFLINVLTDLISSELSDVSTFKTHLIVLSSLTETSRANLFLIR